ncbi:MAG: hypothetical protein H7332_11720, partial [Bdellovibrionales bacterium]|nr:hypothetical protein [Ramlibacter sp.]
EACKKICTAAAGKKAPVMVACTGWGQSEDRKRSDEAGFNHHLVKPVDPEVLSVLLGTIFTTLHSVP